jgi:hypothetical protein
MSAHILDNFIEKTELGEYSFHHMKQLPERFFPTFLHFTALRPDLPLLLVQCLIISDETFYVSGHVNRHSCRVWGSKNPRVIMEQRCTGFLHACSALCKCANWLCRTCTPHHAVAGRSCLTQSPFAFPSNCRCGPPLTSHMPGRSIPSVWVFAVTGRNVNEH